MKGSAFRLVLVFERLTLRGCQCLWALGRVKPLRILTLPCQETNPDGVTLGGNKGRRGLEKQRIIFDGRLAGARIEERRWNRSKTGFYVLRRLRK